MAKKKKSFAERVSNLEEREGILYGFIDDIRALSKKMDKRISEHDEEMREMRREHEERMLKLEERDARISDTHSLLGRLLLRMNETLEDHERRLPPAIA